MITFDKNFVDIEVNSDLSKPYSFDLTIHRNFTASELSKYKFHVAIERGFWVDVLPISSSTLSTGLGQHTLSLSSTKLKNNDGTIRFYATEQTVNSTVPLKRLYSKRIKLGLQGGSSNESLLNIKLTSDLLDVLYKVDVHDSEPVLLIHQIDGEKYAEKFIIENDIFKAGIFPDILTDLFVIVNDGANEIDSLVKEEWTLFFTKVSEMTGRSLNIDLDRDSKREIFAAFLSKYNYRDNFIKRILEEGSI